MLSVKHVFFFKECCATFAWPSNFKGKGGWRSGAKCHAPRLRRRASRSMQSQIITKRQKLWLQQPRPSSRKASGKPSCYFMPYTVCLSTDFVEVLYQTPKFILNIVYAVWRASRLFYSLSNGLTLTQQTHEFGLWVQLSLNLCAIECL